MFTITVYHIWRSQTLFSSQKQGLMCRTQSSCCKLSSSLCHSVGPFTEQLEQNTQRAREIPINQLYTVELTVLDVGKNSPFLYTAGLELCSAFWELFIISSFLPQFQPVGQRHQHTFLLGCRFITPSFLLYVCVCAWSPLCIGLASFSIT